MAHRADTYDVHPSIAMVRTWIAALKEKSGRSLEEWMRFIKQEGPATEEGRRDWLKKDLGLGTNTAWWLAERSVGKGEFGETPEGYLESAAAYVEAMYAGPKGALRPIHDAIIVAARGIAPDVKVCPCKTVVPLFRNHVFAQVRPSTRRRIDLGFALGPLVKEGKKIPARLVETGGFQKKDRITHRIGITGVGEVDAGVVEWMRTAYELDDAGRSSSAPARLKT